jgi:hypothetical protein
MPLPLSLQTLRYRFFLHIVSKTVPHLLENIALLTLVLHLQVHGSETVLGLGVSGCHCLLAQIHDQPVWKVCLAYPCFGLACGEV